MSKPIITVIVREIGTKNIVKSIPAKSEINAEKIARGLEINLNHELYCVEICND